MPTNRFDNKSSIRLWFAIIGILFSENYNKNNNKKCFSLKKEYWTFSTLILAWLDYKITVLKCSKVGLNNKDANDDGERRDEREKKEEEENKLNDEFVGERMENRVSYIKS